ncbi:hypothetical protein BCR42DRAFT_423434 [Absidia repens]|uniref:Homeobox domain-containing protein n=1 Tax=Absidia repens TaxID=90262 RepID=A0A1X2I5Q9_9FUNG|nr:hypothetical protein BCR42DRAFT_423434 [Absidia repens]
MAKIDYSSSLSFYHFIFIYIKITMLSVHNMLNQELNQMDTKEISTSHASPPIRPTALTISHLLCEPSMKTPSLSPCSSPSPVDILPCPFNEKSTVPSTQSLLPPTSYCTRPNLAFQSRPFLPTIHIVNDKRRRSSSLPYSSEINDSNVSSISINYNNEEKETDELNDTDSDGNNDDDQLSTGTSISEASESLKAKRKRANSKQLETLNQVFDRTFFPSTQMRAELGKQLAMSPRTVQIWFQNKRQAMRTKERQRLLKLKNGLV